MNAQQNKLSLFFLEATTLTVCTAKKPQGTSINFPPGVIEHMEIINYDKLHEVIAQLCVTLELEGSAAVIVLGKSLTFEKQVPPLMEEKLLEQLDAFKEVTPFERTAAHMYKNAQGSLFVSMNRDFYDTFRQILDRTGVKTAGIVPQFVYAEIVGAGPIQARTFSVLESHLDEIELRSIITHKFIPKTLQQKQEYISKRYSGIVVVIFIVFLVALVGGTGYILRSQFRSVRTPVSVPTAPQPSSLPVATQTPAIDAEATALPLASASALQIDILYGAGTASQAANLQKNLRAQSYSQVNLQSTAVSVAEPLLLFNSTVPEGNRQQLIRSVRELFPTIGVQDAQLDTDVRITLGK